MRIRGTVAAAISLCAVLCACSAELAPQPALAPLPTVTPQQMTLIDRAPAAVLGTGVPCVARAPLNADLARDLVDAMEDYDGDWGFALYDLECEAMVTVNPEYSQYPASASKIIPVIAVMRAVEDGDVMLDEVEPLIEAVMVWSADLEADELETYVTAEDLSAVLADAGIADGSYIDESWHHTQMTAADMARVWAALLRGNLLNREATDYLLHEAQLAVVPAEYETWPAAPPGIEGFAFGQKAGYWVSDGVPYDFVGAGFELDVVNPGASFVPVVFILTNNEDLLDEQRRQIWPLVEEHIRRVRLLPPAQGETTHAPG